MKRLIPILLLMFFSAPVMAVEPITGAFGQVLGKVWDGEATYTSERDGYFRHNFIPEYPLDAFESYTVEVTPVKGLIFRITAYKSDSCKSQYLAFRQALLKKYGSGEELSISHILMRKWTQGNRTIELECDYAPRLTLIYTDHAIYESRLDELEPDTSNL